MMFKKTFLFFLFFHLVAYSKVSALSTDTFEDKESHVLEVVLNGGKKIALFSKLNIAIVESGESNDPPSLNRNAGCFEVGDFSVDISDPFPEIMGRLQDPDNQTRVMGAVLSTFDGTLDSDFKHTLTFLNAENAKNGKISKEPVEVWRSLLEMTEGYIQRGSKAALVYKPVCKNALAVALHSQLQSLSPNNSLNAFEDIISLLRFADQASYMPARKNLALILFQQASALNYTLGNKGNSLISPEVRLLQAQMVKSLEESRTLGNEFPTAPYYYMREELLGRLLLHLAHKATEESTTTSYLKRSLVAFDKAVSFLSPENESVCLRIRECQTTTRQLLERNWEDWSFERFRMMTHERLESFEGMLPCDLLSFCYSSLDTLDYYVRQSCQRSLQFKAFLERELALGIDRASLKKPSHERSEHLRRVIDLLRSSLVAKDEKNKDKLISLLYERGLLLETLISETPSKLTLSKSLQLQREIISHFEEGASLGNFACKGLEFKLNELGRTEMAVSKEIKNKAKTEMEVSKKIKDNAEAKKLLTSALSTFEKASNLQASENERLKRALEINDHEYNHLNLTLNLLISGRIHPQQGTRASQITALKEDMGQKRAVKKDLSKELGQNERLKNMLDLNTQIARSERTIDLNTQITPEDPAKNRTQS